MRQRQECPHCHGTGWSEPVDSATMLADMKETVRNKHGEVNTVHCRTQRAGEDLSMRCQIWQILALSSKISLTLVGFARRR